MRQLQSVFFVLLLVCAVCPSGNAFVRVDTTNVGSELSQIQQLIQKGQNGEALGRVRRA